jgi:hypothetical protein
MSMLDWSTYRQRLMARVGEIAKISPIHSRAIRR